MELSDISTRPHTDGSTGVAPSDNERLVALLASYLTGQLNAGHQPDTEGYKSPIQHQNIAQHLQQHLADGNADGNSNSYYGRWNDQVSSEALSSNMNILII